VGAGEGGVRGDGAVPPLPRSKRGSFGAVLFFKF